MDFDDVLKKRRTTRDFLADKAVPDELLTKILGAAFLAPTNDHLHQIEFVVVRDRKKIQEIIAPVDSNTEQIQGAALAGARGLMDDDEYAMFCDALPKQKRMLIQSGCLVLPFFRNPGKPLTHIEEQTGLNYFASVWCAIENIFLAATNEGLACTLRIPINDEIEHVKQVTGAPQGWEFACFLAIGYRDPAASPVKQKTIDVARHIHTDYFATREQHRDVFVSLPEDLSHT